jgi:hypothetical protein
MSVAFGAAGSSGETIARHTRAAAPAAFNRRAGGSKRTSGAVSERAQIG